MQDNLDELRVLRKVAVKYLPDNPRIEFQDTNFGEVLDGPQVTYRPLASGSRGEPSIRAGTSFLDRSQLVAYADIMDELVDVFTTYNQLCSRCYKATYVVGNLQPRDDADGYKIVITRVKTKEY